MTQVHLNEIKGLEMTNSTLQALRSTLVSDDLKAACLLHGEIERLKMLPAHELLVENIERLEADFHTLWDPAMRRVMEWEENDECKTGEVSRRDAEIAEGVNHEAE